MRTGLDLVLDRPLPLAGAVVSARPMAARARDARACAPRDRAGAGSSSTGDGISLRRRPRRAGPRRRRPAARDRVRGAERARPQSCSTAPSSRRAASASTRRSTSPVLSVPPRVGRLQPPRFAARRAPGDRDRRATDRAQRQRRRDRALLLPRARLRRPGEARPGRARRRRSRPPSRARTTTGRRASARSTARAPRAAVVAGAAAVLAQARPGLRGLDLRSLLTGTARSLPDASVIRAGRRACSTSGRLGARVTADPVTLAFGRAEGDGWHVDPGRRRFATSRRGACSSVSSTAGQGGLLIDSTPKLGAPEARRPRDRQRCAPACRERRREDGSAEGRCC